MKKISLYLFIFLLFTSCKGVGSAIDNLSAKKVQERLHASKNLLSFAKDIKPEQIKIIERKLNLIENNEIIYNVINAISHVKSKKVNNMILRFLSRRNYRIKDNRVLWLIMEIFVNTRDHRILTALPVRLRFSRKNYKIFAWGYSEFGEIRYFKDLYVIFKTTPSGEIRRYLRVTLNKILKENGIYINNEKQLSSLLTMLRSTWKYIPGTKRDYKDEIEEQEKANNKENENNIKLKTNDGKNEEKVKVDIKTKKALKKELEKAFSEKQEKSKNKNSTK